jgi:hypothetical protein
MKVTEQKTTVHIYGECREGDNPHGILEDNDRNREEDKPKLIPFGPKKQMTCQDTRDE